MPYTSDMIHAEECRRDDLRQGWRVLEEIRQAVIDGRTTAEESEPYVRDAIEYIIVGSHGGRIRVSR